MGVTASCEIRSFFSFLLHTFPWKKHSNGKLDWLIVNKKHKIEGHMKTDVVRKKTF